MKFMEEKKYVPSTPHEYWCNVCDYNVVNSTKPDTGDFFLFSGHTFDQRTKEYDGIYAMVLTAVCKSCQQ